MSESANRPGPKPDWFRVRGNSGPVNEEVMALIKKLNLHTVCEEANCPNQGECFRHKTATFMILGNNCTRRCTFCAVAKGCPQDPDPDEPVHIAEAAKALGLLHVVITSVTRDDLPDGGAAHFAAVTRAIRVLLPENSPIIEELIPDLQGNWDALAVITAEAPEIINHNIETVPRIYSEVRPQADYKRSLELLRQVKTINPKVLTKSGIMVGLGETFDEVTAVMQDLRSAGCDLLTVGQYLAPSPKHHPVMEYIHPTVFEKYRLTAEKLGFIHAASGPLVRSSYHADEAYRKVVSIVQDKSSCT